ncbi:MULTISPECIES: DUF4123 domain-containing protein [unclassified Brenneria]|uniref:DUF4123 domain-containing protein n=1 Tax=unclassified Brenneria TaxID=2634434 RepID=UPI00155511C7|nr:DUF4123 domain-containing protein [Brenneria sp. hezel4-2-4]MEE3652493.1 DUF4123 domain-containing protein [Brenneria sp. HEZEL_4_2_4]NPD02449.1 DUF4123 domain-containing protein [Brenneria sp. hezel4-2-4]
MSGSVQYAVIDGAVEEGLLDFLAEHNPPHCCLYAEPLQHELAPLAPYLVEVTSEVSSWLINKTTPWGIYLFTSAVMKDLRHHLRKYLQIIIPSEEKPVFFRFYDPRNIWGFCQVLTAWELHCFMGPIEKMVTAYDGIIWEEHFQSVREPFPKIVQNRMKLFKINQFQLNAINQCAEERYIDGLISQIRSQYAEIIQPVLTDERQWKINQEHYFYKESSDNNPADFSAESIVKDCYYFCKMKGIEDDRSIRGLLHLLIEKNIYSFKKIPELWRKTLSNESLPGYFRVECLLKETLGYIPR